MEFAATAYAEGISGHAVGMEVEILVDTIDHTIEGLRLAASHFMQQISGLPEHHEEEQLYAEEAEAYEHTADRWVELREAIIRHPENEGLHFHE